MAYQYNGPQAEEVNGVLRALESAFQGAFGPNLVGLYLHGSMAMGSFNPWSSDIDLLAVTGVEPTRQEKLDLAGRVMAIAGDDCHHKIELSVLTAVQAREAHHPIGFVQHYSTTWHERYRLGQAELVLAGGDDEDLAAHVTVLHARGQVLLGAPIAETFGVVPREDYLRAVLYDIGSAREAIHEPSDAVSIQPAFTILNLCRTLRYLREGFVGSKREGGEWALKQEDLAAHRPVVSAALAQYIDETPCACDAAALTAFADALLTAIGEALPAGLPA